MSVGVMLPAREALRADDPALITRFARAAEDLGLDGVWTGDSLLARPLFDPLVTLATVAAVTDRITLGTAALLAPLRGAVTTAHAIASLDRISGGRVIIGAGRGFDLPETRAEFAAAGVDFDTRSRRFTETIPTWRRSWASDDGLEPKPAQPGGPPIWLCGYGPAAFRRTGRIADGWLPYPPTPDDYASGLEQVHQAAAEAGRDPSSIAPAVMVTAAIGEHDAAYEQLTAYMQSFYGYPLEIVSLLQATASGTSDDISATLGTYHDAGARHLIVRLASLDDPIGQLRMFANDVLPAIREETKHAAAV